MCKSRLHERIDLRLVDRQQSPHPNPIVRPTRNHMLAIQREQHRILLILRLVQSIQPLARSRVPKLHRLVRTRTRQHLPIRTERQVKDCPRVHLDSMLHLAALRIPNRHHPVITTRRHELPIRRKRRIIKHIATPPSKLSHLLPTRHIPNHRDPTDTGHPTRRQQPLAIRRKTHRIDRPRMPTKNRLHLSRLHIQKLHRILLSNSKPSPIR